MASTSFTQGIRISTLVDLLQNKAGQRPEAHAYTFLTNKGEQEDCLTYGELARRARAIGAQLQARGLQGERVLLLYPPSLEYVVAFFGCLYAGATAVPVYPPQLHSSNDRIQAIAGDAQASIALTKSSLVESVEQHFAHEPSLKQLQCLTTEHFVDSSGWQPPAVTGETIAFLQYTSGSTSTPKGVMVTHSNLLHNLEAIHQAFGFSPASHVVIWLPPYHDMGLIGGFLESLYSGISVTLLSPMDFLKRPLLWLQTITRYRGTVSGGPNFAYDLCVRKITPEQRESLDLSSWEVAFNGAEPIRADTLDRFAKTFAPYGFRREAFYPCYGLAESTLFVTGGEKAAPLKLKSVDAAALEQNRVVAASAQDRETRTLVSCGRPWLGDAVVIVDPESRLECEPGQTGEIWVTGDSVAGGYWKREQETAHTFQAYIANTEVGPFLRTGDLGFVQDGELFVTGRLKDLIIIDGHNHYPQDIEYTVAHNHSAIDPGNCAAFSIDVDGSERLVIMARVKKYELGDQPIEQALKAMETSIGRVAAQHHHIRPYRIVLMMAGSIPKTSSGKIQRYACRARFLRENQIASVHASHG